MDTTSKYAFEKINPRWLKLRQVFASDKTIAGLPIVCEELRTIPSKSPTEIRPHYTPNRQVYAVACVQAHNIFTADEKEEMRKSKKGRKILRNNRPAYTFLVWFMWKDDLRRIKNGVDVPLRNPVPVSRMLSFFPSELAIIPTQSTAITITHG